MEEQELAPVSRYLAVRRLQLHYLDWGGPKDNPMVLLHGLAGHAHVWDFFAPSFREQFWVLALDQRGHGDSQWHPRGAYGWEEHLLDICAFMEGLDLAPATVVGHSMGGRHAVLLAACFPERVRSLVLVDSRPETNGPGSSLVKETMEAFTREVDSLDEVVVQARQLFPALAEPVARHLAHWGGRPLPGGRLRPKYDAALYHQRRAAGWEVTPLWAYLESVVCPTLVVRGADSPVLPRETAHRMARTLRDGHLAEISGSGHLVPLENPQGLCAAVASFCGGTGGRSKGRGEMSPTIPA